MLDNYFNYKNIGQILKSVIAGDNLFDTAYIMFLNPVILADGGLILVVFLQQQLLQQH